MDFIVSPFCSGAVEPRSLLRHVSFNPSRYKEKNMQQFKVLQRPLRTR
ncbi:hypothetical protein GHK62_32200 [Sinorhizobium terangae]|uniref:Uncharacterized protein n=1 Tax=Sinorhizobium terangae TaxID=110322 RepID=A0A6N7LMW4_SINTE|nr:hypothetical protein [Sinorhizobium terangae]